jgi:hypothetical protein
MRRTLSGWLVLLLAASASGVEAAAPPVPDGPRTVIRRAVRAVGGQELLTRQIASHNRWKFRWEAGAVGGQTIEMDGEALVQTGGKPIRLGYFGKPGDNIARETLIVINGKNSWQSQDGKVEDFKDIDSERMQSASHTDRVTGLVALLRDNQFVLTAFAGGQVDGKPVDGVRVSAKGKKDVDLYFDRATGLLVKFSHRFKDGGKEVLWEMTLSDYRDMSAAWDEQLLKKAELPGDDRALLDFLRKQIPTPARLARVGELVKQLGDEVFAVREKAEAGLLELGAVALPALRKASKDTDLEVRRRSSRLVWRIQKRAGQPLTAAAVHLLALRRTDGAVKVLLDLLPGLEEPLTSDVYAALACFALRNGKPDPALLAALGDKDAVKKAAAAAVLGRDGGVYLKKPGRRLFLRSPLRPTRVVNTVDGQTRRSLETVEVIYYNRLDDKLFERPR